MRLLPYLTSAVALLLIAMMYFLGVYSERTGFVDQVLDPGIKRIAHPVLNAFRGKPPVVPMLRLVLADADHDSLEAVRRGASELGWLGPEGNPLFPAQATVDGQTIAALAGLREGNGEVYAGKRWPLHVRLSGGNLLQGMTTFDLVPVTDSTHLRAWLFQTVLRDQGLPSLGHAFTEARLNDKDMGLCAMESHVDATQLERWGRGPGPVVRFDDGLWNNARHAMGQRLFYSTMPPQGDWLAAPILASRQGVVLEDPDGARRFQTAVNALDAFRNGTMAPSEVFDADAMARLLALADLFGAGETVHWWSMRFLADSVSGKLAALPQRGHAGEAISGLLATRTTAPLRFPMRTSGYLDRLFGDTAIYQRYIAYLDTFSTEGWLEGLLDRIQPELAIQERIVTAEYPGTGIDRNVFIHDRTVIQQNLRPRDLMLAYTQAVGTGRRRVLAANVHSLPVLVDAVIIGPDTLLLSKPLVLWPRETGKPLAYTPIPLQIPLATEASLALRATVMGLHDRRIVPVRIWSSFPVN